MHREGQLNRVKSHEKHAGAPSHTHLFRVQAEGEASDPLDSAKYTCHVSEECATGLAKSLGLRLADYVRYV